MKQGSSIEEAVNVLQNLPVTKVPVSLTVAQGADLAQCPTSLDLTTDRGKAMAFNASAASEVEPDEKGKLHILATDYLVLPASSVDDETGEVREYCYLVLFDKSGNFIKTTSGVVKDRIGKAMCLYNPGHWQRGIPFLIQSRMNPKTKRVYHQVTVDLSHYSQG